MFGKKQNYLLLLIILLLHGYMFAHQPDDQQNLPCMVSEIDNPIMPVLHTQGIDWRNDWHYITYLFISEDDNTPYFRTYPFTSITSSGFYKLASNVTSQITISVPNVTLDLNGHTVSGGVNGIVINGGLSNITIKDGTVIGSVDGIQVNGGCRDIALNQVTAKNCLRGMNFQQVTDAIIRNCDFTLNTTGLELDTSHNIYVENCVAQANTQAGFSLITSTTCSLQNCKALSTGDGNINLFGATSNIFGFVSSNGHGNIFENCIANSSQGLTTTDQNSVIAGFGLKGTEECSKIIGCEASTAMTSPQGATIPYGIWLESRFDSLTTVTATALSNNGFFEGTFAVDWSPDGNYLAAGLFLTTISQSLIVYRFDRMIPNLIIVDAAIPDIISLLTAVKWSPDGQYIAAGSSLNSAANDLFIFRFDQSSEQLTQILSINPGGAGVEDSVGSVDWSPDGNYLAVGLSAADTTTGFALFIYKFDRIAQTLTEVESLNPDNAGAGGASVHAVQWSPDGAYLAVGGNFTGTTGNALFLYSFNRSTERLTQVDSQSPDNGGTGDTVEIVAWMPNGQYLAVGGNFNGATLRDLVLYRFNQSTKTLTKVDALNPDGGSGGDTVNALHWTSDSTYLAVGGILSDTTGNDLFIFKFNRATESLEQITSINPGGTGTTDSVEDLRWSPDGNYLAIGGIFENVVLPTESIYIFTGLQFPENNVINNNTVYCDAGSSIPGGVGISGSSIANLIIGNTAYSNPTNPSIISSNYQFVCNVFKPLFQDEPTALQNIELNSDQPIPSRYDIPAALNRLEVLTESLVDNLL